MGTIVSRLHALTIAAIGMLVASLLLVVPSSAHADESASISGRVVLDEGGVPEGGQGFHVLVYAIPVGLGGDPYATGISTWRGQAAADGSCTIGGLPAGIYTVQTWSGTPDISNERSGPYVDEFYADAANVAAATPVSVAGGAKVAGIDFSLARANATLKSAVPTMSGTAAVGSTLTAKPGTWLSGTVFSYQWFAGAVKISGATKSTLKLAAAQKSKAVTVTVTGTKTGYASVSKTSAKSLLVATVATPTISGTVASGSTLTVKPGTWTSGTAFTYQWYADGKAISKATKSTVKLVAAQKAKKITVKVTGKKAGYTTVAKTSKASLKVATVATPTISGTKTVGKTLTAKPGTWTSGTAFTYQWYADSKAISKATKSTLKLTSAHKGKAITVKVTGKKSGYATVAKTSKATSKVK